MSHEGQTAAEAVKARDEFVRRTIEDARRHASTGDRNGALDRLGQACHPIQDAASPEHTDSKGAPKQWNPNWPFGHSPNDYVGNETSSDITRSIYNQQDQSMRRMYDQVFGK